MQVGNHVSLFKNINLKWSIPSETWRKGIKPEHMLKDPSKGIVHKKFEGSVVKVLEDGDTLTDAEISFFSLGNHIMQKSFNAGSERKGLRIVAEFPECVVGRYRILHSHMWELGNSKSIKGYVDIVPNSIKFIKEA